MIKFGDNEKFLPLDALKSILNGMDTYLYVSDIQTNELLLVNDKIKEHFNLSDDVLGSTCREIFQNKFEKRCNSCPIPKLLENPNTPIVWEDYNTETGKYYKRVDRVAEWADGKMAHLHCSTDITDIKLAQETIDKRLKQQELMSAISQIFTTAQDTPHLFHEALKMAGEFLGFNRAFLSKYEKDEGYLECLHEWCDENSRPFIGDKYKWPFSPDMQIYKDLTINGYAAVSDYLLLTHPNFEIVKDYDLRAFINFPINISGEFWGIIGFIINKHTYVWNESDIHMGKLIAGVFSGVVSRHMAEQKLLNAIEMAEKASKVKGEFLSHMSHEIRTPMNAIIGMTGIARNSDDKQKMEYCLQRIDIASKHLLGIINDVLDISKIEANMLELSPVEFDFERMLTNITGVVNFRAEEKRQNLIINVDSQISSVFIGDEMRLSQVIANLLSNSVKFAPEGGLIMLNVRNVDVSDGISTLLFEVIDNGIGIPKEQQAKLFNPFEQADGSITRKYGGTGLGLTISKKIVELMGGRIWIESDPGKGTKFSFTVKAKIGNCSSCPKPADVIDKGNIRILVVEQISEMKDYFTRVMSELGLTCDIVDSGPAALEMIEQNKDKPYNIFFLDRVMPDFNGIETAKKIKNISTNNTVIIVTSASDWSNIEKGTAASGVDKFILKPLFPSKLINVINESMGTKSEDGEKQNKAHTYDFKNRNLLIAEDVEINREIIAALLKNTGISIDFAWNGAEALSMVENNPEKYDLILMDIQMPEMDGYVSTQRIRSLDMEKAKNIPIIAMTANVFQEDVMKCLQAGMNDHIGKPINTKVLLSKLDKYLHQEQARCVVDS